ncbi:hypothetical protein WR25_03207 isoform B [Diploscapter pachys]|uniref:C2 domain-containing protein n=1 Tax=Diploscapter pachys TaxID=2018661 RepID=A0A2A2KZ05_9BILA|nr:hypothetical protein WR25_03207 isoform B [Diploscapter pachys]
MARNFLRSKSSSIVPNDPQTSSASPNPLPFAQTPNKLQGFLDKMPPQLKNIQQNFTARINTMRSKLKLPNKLQVPNKLSKTQWEFLIISVILVVVLVCIYFIALISASPHSGEYFKALTWVLTEMVWLLVFWGMMAAVCYFALNHLGATPSSAVMGSDSSTRQTTNGTTAATGSSEWTNEVVKWLYDNLHKVPQPLNAWIKSLNDAARKVTSPTVCEVLFEGFGDHSALSNPPRFSNIRVEHGPRDHLTVRSNIHLPCIKLRLVSSQRTPERMIVSNYEASIVDLRGEVECRIASIASQLYLMGCFNGRPEMDIELRNRDPHAPHQVSLGLVEESIRRCLLSAVTNINLSESAAVTDSPIINSLTPSFPIATNGSNRHSMESGSYNMGNYRNSYNEPSGDIFANTNQNTTNQHRLSGSPTAQRVPDMFKKLNESNLMSSSTSSAAHPNRLRVKIINARGIGNNIDVHKPYCVIEMDEPAQKYTSGRGEGSMPTWNETYRFDLTPASEEILFELYEGDNRLSVPADDDSNFLGLSIVNFEEIKRSGKAIHNLRLQGRPYRRDHVSGELTVDFDFYYDPSITVPGKVMDSVRVKRNDGSEFRETVTTQRMPIYDPHDRFDASDIVPTKTTSVTVKSVSQQLKEKPTIQSVHGSMENAVDPATQRIIDETFHNGTKKEIEDRLKKMQGSSKQGRQLESKVKNTVVEVTHLPPSGAQNGQDSRQSRDRNKKEKKDPGEKRESSFFGQLRDRLSGRKLTKRTKSLDINSPEVEEAVSLPPSRDVSRTRYPPGSIIISFLIESTRFDNSRPIRQSSFPGNLLGRSALW